MKRMRAPRTKSALYEATKSLSTSGANSRKIVDQVKAEYHKIIGEEEEDLLDLALMVLAGRISIKPMDKDLQEDFFGEEKPREFVNIELSENGHWEPKRLSSLDTPLGDWRSRRITEQRPKIKHKTNEEILDKKFEEMISKGAGPDETIRSFFGTGSLFTPS